MNRMTDLLDKIERRLGTKPLNLPEEICKKVWAEKVIVKDTISTFSRFWPNSTLILINTKRRTPDGYCLIDEELLGSGVEILGVKDINWDMYTQSRFRQSGFGVQDWFSSSLNMDDIGLSQLGADHKSMFKNTIFLEFKEPNKVKFTTMTSTSILQEDVPVDILITHPSNLMTISPTVMETFEDLAIADVASFLYEYLKNFDGIATVYADIDMKLDQLQSKASRRDDIVQLLKDSYINPSNTNQPDIICV